MKRALTLFAFLLATFAIFAQDVIITTDAKKIDAKILEVSKSEIKYKESDNLDGPLFILATSDINSIIYSNGKVVLYNSTSAEQSSHSLEPTNTANQERETVVTPSKTSSEPDNSATIFLRSGETMQVQISSMNRDGVIFVKNGSSEWLAASKIEKIVFDNGQVKSYITSEVINNSQPKQHVESDQKTIYTAAEFTGDVMPKFVYTKVDVPGKKYKKNRYVGGNMILTDKEMANFLQMHCPEAYEMYRKASVYLILECCFIPLLIPALVFGGISISYSTKVLPTYNAQCGGKPSAMVELDINHQDCVQLATVDFHLQK